MPISIKDLAKLAGVSHSTVSRALRASPLIPEKTASRIQKLAKETGYTANAIGRGLVKGRTEAIGVVVTSIADPFNGEVVEGLEEVANQHGYSVILATSQASAEREIAVVKSFQSRRVDGIIVASSRVGASYLPFLAATEIPVVLLNNQHPGGEPGYSVRIDNQQGAYSATRHLVQLGHRQIGYIGDRYGLRSDAERREGFHQAMNEAGLEVEPKWEAWGNGKADGAAATFRTLAQQRLPSALVCYNDMSAVGVMEAARQQGLSLPDDLSITGFDDIQLAASLNPALTTVRQPKLQLGREAMDLLLRVLRGEMARPSLVLHGELIERLSTTHVKPT